MLSPLLRRPPCIALGWVIASAFAFSLPAQPASGPRLFEIHCAGCHGPHGEGSVGPTLAQPSLPRGRDLASIERIIATGFPGTEMPAARVNPVELSVLAAYVKNLGSRPVEKLPGNSQRGAQLYTARGACVTCHMLHGQGAAIGPDLTEIGLKRSATYLRRALLEPGADVPQSFTAFRADISLPENFLFVRVTTRDGRLVAGVRVNEDTFSIQIRDLSGQMHSFFKSDLANLSKDWGYSPMPSYAGIFTPGEVDDLVAFLASLRGVPALIEPEKANQMETNFH